MDERQFATSVKNNPLHCYYITGNDLYTAEKCISFVSKAVKADPESVDLKKVTTEELGDYFYSYSFLGGNRLLVLPAFFVKQVPSETLKYLEETIQDTPEDLYIIITALNADENRFSVAKDIQKLLDLVPGGGDSLILFKKRGYGLSELVKSMAKANGSTIDSNAVDRLIALRGDDSLILENEIRKLAAASGYGNITQGMVDDLCVRTVESGVYDMLRLLENGNEKGCLDLLSDMLKQRMEPIMIAGTLNTAFINIARAKALKGSGRPMSEMFVLFDYPKTDKKVEIAWKQADHFGGGSIRKAIEVLYQLDMDLKSSKGDKGILLECAALSLCSFCQ